MTNPQPTGQLKIELDMGAQGSPDISASRRSRPIIPQAPQPEIPKLEPVLNESKVASDEAERTVAIFFLLTALPGLLSLLLGRGTAGLSTVVIPIVFGIGLLRGSELIQQWVLWGCVAQLVLGPISFFIAPSSSIYTIGGVLQSLGLLILVSGKAISKNTYYVCLGGVAFGTLIGIIGSLLH